MCHLNEEVVTCAHSAVDSVVTHQSLGVLPNVDVHLH